MNLESYKAVFFDVGGTLLKVHPSVGEVYAKHARRFGFEGSGEELNHEFALAWKELGGLESLGKQSGPDVEQQFWRTIVKRVFHAHGGLVNFDDYFNIIYKVFLSAENWKVYDDVLESGILEKLKSRGTTLGVISNWDSRLEGILEATSLASYFDFILASTVVGSAKPDRKIFDKALHLASVKPSLACHIGDEPETDILGARRAGIDAILLDRKNTHQVRDGIVIRSFNQLRA